MPVLPQHMTRSGTNKMMQLARALCLGVRVAEPTIRAKNASKPGVIAVLDACMTVCSLLPAADAEIAADGMTAAEFYPSNTTTTPGSLPTV